MYKISDFYSLQEKIDFEVEKDFDNFDKRFAMAFNSIDENETISIKHLREMMNYDYQSTILIDQMNRVVS